MTFKYKIVLAGLTFALVSFPACRQAQFTARPGQHQGQGHQREFPIYVYIDPNDTSRCYADIAVATLWRNQDQKVKWISDDGGEYFVDFAQGHNGSPFGQPNFYVPKNGDVGSGKLMQAGKYYDYAIFAGKDATAPMCKPTSDPGFYVK
jgi:hypothetical protein